MTTKDSEKVRQMPQLVLLRHGQSAWNLENRFTGWWDVNLTPQGEQEAKAAGELLAAKGFDFDLCFTSFQTRAIKTLNIALEAMGRLWLPVEKHWRLNERHYGGLTGLDKAETAAKHGEEQVKAWRRSFDIPPPAMEPGGAFDLTNDRRYAGIAISEGKRVLISAHGNSLRALVKHLSNIADDEIVALEIPTGQPIVYDLDEGLGAIERYFLKDR